MGNRWDEVEELMVKCAEADLEQSGEVAPALVAFSGQQLQFIAWLRSFEKGAYHDPVIELLALAMPLDVDRLALSLAGRAWSFDDPIPPVSEDADLRQRVLVLHFVDGAQGTPRPHSIVRAFDLGDGTVRWGEPRRLDGGQGWIFEALEVAVHRRARLRAPLSEIRTQAARVVELGHDLHLSPELARRFGVAPARPP